MTEDEIKDKKELLITLVVISAVIIASTFLYFYWSDEPGNIFEPIDRTITFPNDEGLHNETFEKWGIHGTFETKSGDSFELMIRWIKHIDEDKVSVEYMFRDNENLTQHHTFEHVGSGDLIGSYNELDLILTSGQTSTEMESKGRFTYLFNTGIGDDIKIELNVNSRKDPILFRDDGKLFQPGFGTIFGYYQPHLDLSGTIYISEIGVLDIDGVGWLEHVWGGDIKSLFTETWYIHLDNSVDIFIIKMYDYDPDLYYPDELFLYVVNIVRTDGKLITPILMDDIHLDNLDYHVYNQRYHHTTDRWQYIAWPSEWRLHSNDIDIIITTSSNSLHNNAYLGFIEAQGFYMGQRVRGTGVGEFTYNYISFPKIEEVSDTFSLLRINDPVEITSIISYIPPFEPTDIYVKYSVNDGEWIRLEMDFIDGFWRTVIPPQLGLSTVYYRVVVEDMLDNVVESEVFSYSYTA